jgi:hypothetical protein
MLPLSMARSTRVCGAIVINAAGGVNSAWTLDMAYSLIPIQIGNTLSSHREELAIIGFGVAYVLRFAFVIAAENLSNPRHTINVPIECGAGEDCTGVDVVEVNEGCHLIGS